MNTFGASKYLEAEQLVVEGIMADLKDQLTRLKIEELAIRAAIRRHMTVKQTEPAQLLDQNSVASVQQELLVTTAAGHSGLGKESSNSHAISGYSQPSTSRDYEQLPQKNEPIEVSINAALELINEYREKDFISQSGEDTLDTIGGEMEDTEIDDDTEPDEPTTVNEDLNFLDLRNCGFDEADFDA